MEGKEGGRLATASWCCSMLCTACPTKQALRWCCYYCTTALPARVTAVCANSLPLADAPVCSVIDVCESTTPSKCAVVPTSTTPKTCQMTFWTSAPPVRMTLVADASVTPCAIWKIQTSFAEPLRVTSLEMVTVFDHL